VQNDSVAANALFIKEWQKVWHNEKSPDINRQELFFLAAQ
jgi:hypothetical protein